MKNLALVKNQNLYWTISFLAFSFISCGGKDTPKQQDPVTTAAPVSIQKLDGNWNLTSINCDGTEYYVNGGLVNLGGAPATHSMKITGSDGVWEWNLGFCTTDISFVAAYPSANDLNTQEGHTTCTELMPQGCAGITQCDDQFRRNADNPFTISNDTLVVNASTQYTVPVICPTGTQVSKLTYQLSH